MPRASNESPKRKKTSTREAVAIMLVDDHPLWRQTLRQVLEAKRVGVVVSEVGDGLQAVEAAKATNPDVVVMDLNLPVMDGVEATRRLVRAHRGIKVLVLSSLDDRARVVEAIRAGASGYLLKTAGSGEIVDAIGRISSGELVFPPSVAPIILDELREDEESNLRLVVADDVVVRRAGLVRIVEEAGFEVAASGPLDELDAMMSRDATTLAVVSVGGRRRSAEQALETARRAWVAHPEIPVLLLVEDLETADPAALLVDHPGRIGYLSTERISHGDELRDAIRRVAAGDAVVDPEVFDHLMRRSREKTPLDELSEGECQVLGLMAEGRSNQAISEALFLSPKTVEARVGSIFAKLGLEPTPDDHRRVLAVITYLRSSSPDS